MLTIVPFGAALLENKILKATSYISLCKIISFWGRVTCKWLSTRSDMYRVTDGIQSPHYGIQVCLRWLWLQTYLSVDISNTGPAGCGSYCPLWM